MKTANYHTTRKVNPTSFMSCARMGVGFSLFGLRVLCGTSSQVMLLVHALIIYNRYIELCSIKHSSMRKIIVLMLFVSVKFFSQSRTNDGLFIFNKHVSDSCFEVGYERAVLEDYKGSIQDFNITIELNPKNDLAYYNRGVNKEKLGDYFGAIQDFNKAIEIKPNKALYYFVKGTCESDLKKYKESILNHTKAIYLDSKFIDAYIDRGYAKFNLGDKKGACLDWSKAGELGDSNIYDVISKNCK